MTERESYLSGVLCDVLRIVDGLSVVQDIIDNDGGDMTEQELTKLRSFPYPVLNVTAHFIANVLMDEDGGSK